MGRHGVDARKHEHHGGRRGRWAHDGLLGASSASRPIAQFRGPPFPGHQVAGGRLSNEHPPTGGLPEVHRTSVVNAPMQDQADDLRSPCRRPNACMESSLAIPVNVTGRRACAAAVPAAVDHRRRRVRPVPRLLSSCCRSGTTVADGRPQTGLEDVEKVVTTGDLKEIESLP